MHRTVDRHCKEGLVFFFWLVHILLDMLSESRMHGDTEIHAEITATEMASVTLHT